MTARPALKSDRAVQAALREIACKSDQVAAILLFHGAARHLRETLGDQWAAEHACREADHMATGGHK